MIFPRVIILQAKSTRLSNLGTVNIVKISFLFPKIDIQFFSMDQQRKIASVQKLEIFKILYDHHENKISILITVTVFSIIKGNCPKCTELLTTNSTKSHLIAKNTWSTFFYILELLQNNYSFLFSRTMYWYISFDILFFSIEFRTKTTLLTNYISKSLTSILKVTEF